MKLGSRALRSLWPRVPPSASPSARIDEHKTSPVVEVPTGNLDVRTCRRWPRPMDDGPASRGKSPCHLALLDRERSGSSSAVLVRKVHAEGSSWHGRYGDRPSPGSVGATLSGRWRAGGSPTTRRAGRQDASRHIHGSGAAENSPQPPLETEPAEGNH